MYKPQITPEECNALLEIIGKGLPYTLAAETIGVSEACIYKWLREGQKPEAPAILVKLVKDIKAARARGIAARLARISTAAEKNWQADAWILERTVPEHFSLHKTELDQLRKFVARMEKQHADSGVDAGEGGDREGGDDQEDDATASIVEAAPRTTDSSPSQ